MKLSKITLIVSSIFFFSSPILAETNNSNSSGAGSGYGGAHGSIWDNNSKTPVLGKPTPTIKLYPPIDLPKLFEKLPISAPAKCTNPLCQILIQPIETKIPSKKPIKKIYPKSKSKAPRGRG
jgi:hypothetical protein